MEKAHMKKAKEAQAANPPAAASSTKIRITHSKITVKLFDEPSKNRRFTPEEFQTELELAKWMKRPLDIIFMICFLSMVCT